MQPTPVKEVALRENIPVLQPKKVREPEVVEELSKLIADVIVVVAFGQITRDLWTDKVRLHQRPRLPASEIPRSSADPVGCHERR